MTTPSANTGFSGSTLKNSSDKNSFGIDLTSVFSKNGTEVSAPVVANKAAPMRVEIPVLNFISNPSLGAEDARRRWQRMDVTKLWGSTLKGALANGQLELLKKDHIYCMASGQKEDVSKFYFYAEQRLRSNSDTRLFYGGMQCYNEDKTHCVCFQKN